MSERLKRNQSVAQRPLTEPTAPTPAQVARFKNPHVLTKADRQRGAARTNAIKREAGKSVRERLAERLQAEADSLFDAFVESSKQGDWRALAEALNQAFGRPASQLELTGAVDNHVSIQVVSSMPVPALTPEASSDLAAGEVYELDAGDVEEA